jgi:hypothetical protein
MPGAVTVGGLVINLAAETSQLKTDMAEGMRAVDAGAKTMINSMVGITESSDRATDAGARMVRQLKEEIATFGMSSQEMQQYKANLSGVGGEVEALMGRLNQMKAAQSGFTDQLAASEAAATQRIRDMVAASMSEVATLNDVAAATQGLSAAQATAARVGTDFADSQRLQMLNMQGVTASMKGATEGTAALSAETQRIMAQYDPLGAKLRALQSDQATLRKEMGNSVDPAAIKAFQGLEDEISKTQALMARAAVQANALGSSTSQLTQTQTQLIERFRDQAATIGMSRSQLMTYQAAQAGVTDQTKAAIAAVKAHEEAIKAAADAKEKDRSATTMMTDALKLLATGYAAMKIGEFVKDSAMLAARYETLEVVMGVVGRTAGYTKTQMDAAAEGVAKQGITMKESRDSVVKLVQAHIDLSNASTLARIAQDAAVIGNINSTEAFERLVNGVARGNVLILRNIGINVNLQAAYDQMATSLGKSSRELTENERVQARLNAVLERGTDIAGTYEAAMDTASKQITSMKRYTEDLKTTFGEVFSETLTIGVMALTDELKDANGEVTELAKNGQLQEWGRDLTNVFVGVVNAIDNILNSARMAGTWAAHFNADGAIDKQFHDKYVNASDADKPKVRNEWSAALTREQQQYEAAQVEIAGQFDRFQRAADVRMAARLSKQKANADERLKVDQDYAARATALLIANANKSVEVQQAAQANLAKEVYQGTPNFRDTEGRASKPKVDQADNTRLQDRLARIQEEAAAEKQQTEQQMKLDDMRHSAGEMLDAEYYASRRSNLALLGQTEANMYDQQLAELRAHHSSTQAEEAKNQKAIHDIIGKQTASGNKAFYDQQTDAEAERLREKKLYDDAAKATVGAGASSLKSLDEQIAKQKEHNAEIGKTKEQVELAKQAQVDQASVQLQSDADFLRDGLVKWDLDEKSQALFRIRLNDLDAEIAKRKELSGLFAAGADAEASAKAAAELDKYLDPAKAREFGNALKGSLGSAASSMIALTNAMQKYGKEQAENDKQRAFAQVEFEKGGKSQAWYLDRLSELNARNTKEQLGSYGNMASAAAGFFDEHSRGYQALTTVSQVFHAAELAMTMAELVPKAISAVLTQGQGDPYTAFGRMAAMGALVAGLGVAIGGMSGADTTAKDRQAAQGTGSILGDKDAKSESLKRSFDLIEKNTYQGLAISSSMLATLRSIDSNISSFASHLVSSTDITNPDIQLKSGVSGANMGTVALAAAGFTAGSMVSLIGSVMGPIGALAGLALSKIPAVQKLMTSVFGGKQSVSDSGFSMDPSSLASILGGGAHAYQYADITTSGGWFSSDKHSEQSSTLGDAANQQFTTIITSLAGSIKSAGQMLGLSGDDFTNKLNSFVVDIGHVSLKDLKGDDLQKAVEAVFSKLGDDMAQFAVGGLSEFQQVGEGYLETLARVAAEYQTIDVVFQSFGKTFGEVGLESIGARDRLVQLAGGLDKFTSQGEYFLTNFFSEKEQAAALRARVDPTLAQYGLSSSGEGAMKMFRDFIVCLDTTTEEGAKAYTTLMSIAPVVKQLADAEKAALDERKDLQDQLDELTMSSTQLLAKQRDALDESNRALFDQVQAVKSQAAALQAVKDAAGVALGGVDSAYSVLQKVAAHEKTALQATVDAHSAAVTRLQGLSQALHSAYDGGLAPDQKLAARAMAQAEIKADLAITRAGGVLSDDQVESLKKALSSATEDASTKFSSYQGYLRDLYGTQSDIKQLGDLTDSSLSVEQKALKAAQDQLGALDKILANAQDEIDILKGVDTNGLSLIQAMDGLTKAILSAKANPIVGATGAINQAYQQYLGRAPDAQGLEFWQNAAANGAPTSQIVDGIANSTEANLNKLYQSVLGRAPDAEGLAFWMNAYGPQMDEAEMADWLKDAQKDPGYKGLSGIPGFAGGGDHAGGWRVVGEDGPELEATGPARIFNSHQTSDLFGRLTSPSANADVLSAAVDRLTATVDRQQAVIAQQNVAIAQTQRNTKTMADTLQRLTRGTGALYVQTDPA